MCSLRSKLNPDAPAAEDCAEFEELSDLLSVAAEAAEFVADFEAACDDLASAEFAVLLCEDNRNSVGTSCRDC